jgi:hypothetical protein
VAGAQGAAFRAGAILSRSDLIDGEVTHDGHVACAMVLTQSGLTFLEDDVHHDRQPASRRHAVVEGKKTPQEIKMPLAQTAIDRETAENPFSRL